MDENLTKKLIVNADDCNLTSAVTSAICNAHKKGIVSSTTFLINLPIEKKTIQLMKRHPKLGVGLHLNVTLGRPVSSSKTISGLLNDSGYFIKKPELLYREKIKAYMVREEYLAQICLFKKTFGVLPTHLDTHHQLHDDAFILRILISLANEYGLPIRRSALMDLEPKKYQNIKTSDYLFGSLDVKDYWRLPRLKKTFKELPIGVSEMMCHPGVVDENLKAISSFTKGREEEYKIFSDSKLRENLKEQNIELTHYGICYT